MKIGDWLFPLVVGIGTAVTLNLLVPFFPSVFVFILITVILLYLIFTSTKDKDDLLRLRIVFLGASLASIIFAFYTFFFSIQSSGIVQIPFNALIGLFRSILITSFFSLFERLTKFLEDRQK